jgi:hypothetical protein
MRHGPGGLPGCDFVLALAQFVLILKWLVLL